MPTSNYISTSYLLYFFVLCAGSSDNSNAFVQLYDCTCAGYTQTYKCTVFGGGTTIWQGSAFECSGDRIELRHSRFSNSEGTTGECNEGAIMARSVGVVNGSCYVSILNVTVGEEMNNRTIECVHRDLDGQINIIMVHQKTLNISHTPYAPPSGVHVEKVEMDQLIFTWNEVVPLSQCPYIRYVITATNCGVCPNTTTNTTITCSSFSVSVHENTLCMLTVQTDVCGSLLGEKSDHAIVNITVPSAPRFKLKFRHYSYQNVTVEIAFNQLNVSLSENVDGSPTSYIITLSDHNSGTVCDIFTILSSSCPSTVCTVELTEITPPCSLNEETSVKLSAVNVFGAGLPSEPVIFSLITYESATADGPTTHTKGSLNSALFLPIVVSMTALLVPAVGAVIVCTLVNIKLLKNGSKLKAHLNSQQLGHSQENTNNTELYEEVRDVCQTSVSSYMDINNNAAYLTVNQRSL